MNKRIPITPDDQEYLQELFTEYIQKREDINILQEDCKEINQAISSIFNIYNIEKKEFEEKIFIATERIKYIYPKGEMERLKESKYTQRIFTKCIKMLDITVNMKKKLDRKPKYKYPRLK